MDAVTIQNVLDRILAKFRLDFINKVESLDSMTMFDPKKSLAEGIETAGKFLDNKTYYKPVYPPMVDKMAERTLTAPKCIFIPTKPLIRHIMR
jgi:hypothetical protein